MFTTLKKNHETRKKKEKGKMRRKIPVQGRF
jgi:hypothetical protein